MRVPRATASRRERRALSAATVARLIDYLTRCASNCAEADALLKELEARHDG